LPAWIKDLQGRYVFVNEAAQILFGKNTGAICGQTDYELFPAETADQFRRNDQVALTSSTGIEAIEVLKHEDGIHYSIVSKFPIFDALGRPTYVGGVAIDITERMKAEESLKQADRRKDEFLATLAHELRNPLAPLRNAVHLLKLREPLDPDLVWSRDVIERQVNQMARLLDDLIDVSRITRNKLQLRKAPVEVRTLVANAVEMSRPVLDSESHELSISLPAEPLYLEADAVRLSQVVANLLNNAAKYTNRGGHIWLTVQRDGSELVVSVKDNGIGIAHDVLPRLFEMFSQAVPALERSQGGLGIGLSLVKGLVEMHGGKVEARSNGPEQGSEFVVRLPLVPGPEGYNAIPSEVHNLPGARCKIVVADDNKDAVDSLAMMLRALGHEVRTAKDGQEAIEATATFRPDVVLLDIGMPKLNGYEAARRIREEPWGKQVTLIALTGWGQDEYRQRSREAGFDHHLVKPPDSSELLEILSAVSRVHDRSCPTASEP
jgi:PAS domain S-box-containing protein